jgi:hypothetical protein
VVGGGGPDRRGLFRCEFGVRRLLSLKNQLGDLERVVVIRRRNRGPHIDALLISVEDTLRTDLINKPPSVPVWRQARAMRLEERRWTLRSVIKHAQPAQSIGIPISSRKSAQPAAVRIARPRNRSDWQDLKGTRKGSAPVSGFPLSPPVSIQESEVQLANLRFGDSGRVPAAGSALLISQVVHLAPDGSHKQPFRVVLLEEPISLHRPEDPATSVGEDCPPDQRMPTLNTMTGARQ